MESNRFSQYSHSGFTLIEILIAITLLAFISLGVIGIVNNSIDTKERVVSEDDEKMQLLVGLSRLEWDFSHIYTPLYHGRFPNPAKALNQVEKETWEKEQQKMQGNNNFFALSTEKYPIPNVKQDGQSEIMFLTQGHRRRVENVKESEYAWVHYELAPMENGDEKSSGLFTLTRTLYINNPFSPDSFEKSQDNRAQIIMERLKEFKLEFWDKENKKYVSALKDMNEPLEKNLFRAVKISFTWVDSKGVEEKFLKIVRPLFPYFEEEDLTQNSTSNSSGNSNSGTTSEASTESGNAEDGQ